MFEKERKGKVETVKQAVGQKVREQYLKADSDKKIPNVEKEEKKKVDDDGWGIKPLKVEEQKDK